MKRYRNIKYIIISLVILVLSSCNKGLEPMEYAHWVQNEDNGLKQKITMGKYVMELQYQPLEFIVVMQERTEEISEGLLNAEIKKREDLQYFTFKIGTIEGKGALSDSEMEIENKEIYLISGMKNDFKLIENNDTLDCAMFHFEKSNNILPYDQCVLAFEKISDSIANKTFIYKTDKLNLKDVLFELKGSDINNIPVLKTI